MASTPIGSMADPADDGTARVETTGTAEVSAVPTSRSVFFFTTLFAFRPDAQDYTKTRSGSCDITVCKLSIFCLIFVSEFSRNQYNEPIAGERPREQQRPRLSRPFGEAALSPLHMVGRAPRARRYGTSTTTLKNRMVGRAVPGEPPSFGTSAHGASRLSPSTRPVSPRPSSGSPSARSLLLLLAIRVKYRFLFHPHLFVRPRFRHKSPQDDMPYLAFWYLARRSPVNYPST